MFSLLLSGLLTLVSLNCENLFDCQQDSMKDDWEWTPEGSNRWTPFRYWQKLNNIGREILACGEYDGDWHLPDLVALCEVENDTVLHDLTRRSLLRNAHYDYVMTDSPDLRGIDVALLYSPATFSLISWQALRVEPLEGMRPTRDILYASGVFRERDTLHVFVVHAPSRSGGEVATRPHRMLVARRLTAAVDSVLQRHPSANVLVCGDFNDYSRDRSIRHLEANGLMELSRSACGRHGARGTYRYLGEWGLLDHIFASPAFASRLSECFIFDAPFLLESDDTYGGVKPHRNYLGPRYQHGFSDHLPLVARFRLP